MCTLIVVSPAPVWLIRPRSLVRLSPVSLICLPATLPAVLVQAAPAVLVSKPSDSSLPSLLSSQCAESTVRAPVALMTPLLRTVPAETVVAPLLPIWPSVLPSGAVMPILVSSPVTVTRRPSVPIAVTRPCVLSNDAAVMAIAPRPVMAPRWLCRSATLTLMTPAPACLISPSLLSSVPLSSVRFRPLLAMLPPPLASFPASRKALACSPVWLIVPLVLSRPAASMSIVADWIMRDASLVAASL